MGARPNVIYLTRNMRNYEGANYQREVIESFDKRCRIFTYGDGFEYFSEDDSWMDIRAKSNFNEVDLVILGHSWLSDSPGTSLTKSGCLNLAECECPVVMILNKEYVRLEDKLSYALGQGIRIVFSHHDRVEEFTRPFGLVGHYLPFAASAYLRDRFPDTKFIDVGFSGLLRNKDFPAPQNVRVQFQQEAFFCARDLPLFRRGSSKDLSIFWNAMPPGRVTRRLSTALGRYKHFSEEAYHSAVAGSRLWINSPSPLGIVSPRYFENLVLGAVPLSPRNPALDAIFEPGVHYLPLEPAGGILPQIRSYLNQHDLVRSVGVAGQSLVWEKHLWSHRIDEILNLSLSS